MDAPKCKLCGERHWARVCPKFIKPKVRDLLKPKLKEPKKPKGKKHG